MRSLMVLPSYLPDVGGVAIHVAEVAPRLIKAGVAVEVLTTDRSGLLPKYEVINGVPVHRVASYPKRRDYYFAPGLVPAMRRGRWDVVHCQGVQSFVPPLAMLVAAGRQLPYIVTFHTGGHSSLIRTRLRTLQWLALVPLLRRAHRLIAVSGFEAQVFSGLPGVDASRISIISNGAEAGRPNPSVTVDRDLIVSVGRLERYKGHQKVIEALPELLTRRPHAHVRIAGDGSYANELQALARRLGVATRVEIGAIPPSDRSGMADLMARAGVVALLSDYESQGLAVLEALALGRPVVVTDATALHEFVLGGLAHGVPAQASPREVAEAIVQGLERPTRSSVRIPTWDDCAAQVLEVYRSIGSPAHF